MLKNDKKFKQLGDDLINVLDRVEELTIGKVTDTKYQSDDFANDKVKLKRFDNGTEEWYFTKQELPKKGSIVSVSLNQNWFNYYYILEKSDIIENDSINKNIFLNTKELKTSKDLAFMCGLSSREINSTLVSYGLMEKRGNDWFATLKGETLGGIQREGQYGKFIVWPQEILKELKLS